MHHASTYSILAHILNTLVGSKRQKHFTESSHVAYQIKREWNIELHASR